MAKKGNKNAARDGFSLLVRVRFPDEATYTAVMATTSTAERGDALAQLLNDANGRDENKESELTGRDRWGEMWPDIPIP